MKPIPAIPFFIVICGVVLIGLYGPVHAYLHGHLEFLLGAVIGSWLATSEDWCRWLYHRWLWVRAFSWMCALFALLRKAGM